MRKKPSPKFASVLGHSPTTACESAINRSSLSAKCVAWIKHQLRSTGIVVEQELHRPPLMGSQAFFNLGDLLGDVHVQGHRCTATLQNEFQRSQSIFRFDCPQGVDRGSHAIVGLSPVQLATNFNKFGEAIHVE